MLKIVLGSWLGDKAELLKQCTAGDTVLETGLCFFHKSPAPSPRDTGVAGSVRELTPRRQHPGSHCPVNRREQHPGGL